MPRPIPLELLKNPDNAAFCLQKQITDIKTLRHHLQESVCLSFDTEGCDGMREGVTSIGLAVLPPTDFHTTPFPPAPFSTQQLVDHYQINSHCLYIEGRHRRKPHPPFPFGISATTPDPGSSIEAIIHSIKTRHPSKPILLIAWHPHTRDFPAIQTFFPSLFEEVVGWADVLDVMQQLCFSTQENLTKSWPSLGDMMLCVGFGEECVPLRGVGHSAGSDAVHTVIVLARLLACGEDELPLEVRRQRVLKQWKR